MKIVKKVGKFTLCDLGNEYVYKDQEGHISDPIPKLSKEDGLPKTHLADLLLKRNLVRFIK